MRAGSDGAAHPPQQRRLSWIGTCGLLIAFVALGLAGAAQAAEIKSAGPLTKIRISADLNCEVDHRADAHTEFYGGFACGTLLASGGTLFGPKEIPAGSSASPRTAWTPVSQEGPTGSGTEADPYRVTTVVQGGELRVTEVDTYVVGEESYRADVTVHNAGAESAEVVAYRAGDCYLQNSDYGFGRIDGDAPTCVASEQDPGGGGLKPGSRIEQFTPITAGSNHYQAGYWEVWEWIGSQRPFPDTCRCAEYIDNGAGLSWSRTVAPGKEVRLSSLITFSPVGLVPVVITKKADDETVEAGGATGYTITVSNPNAREVRLTELYDDLPAGFSYLSGSTSGATSDDPEVVGQRLVWRNLVVPENDSIHLHFLVRVADQPGTYVNTANGVAEGIVIVPAEEEAPLPVTEGKLDRRELVLEKSADEPTLIAATQDGYTITVGNPGGKALTLNRIVETLAEGLSYVGGSTTGITTTDPSIEGRRLTWRFDGGVEVPAFSAVRLHFRVRVPVPIGTRLNPLVTGSANAPVQPVESSAEIRPTRPTLGSLRLRKTPSRRSVPAGDAVRFVLVVRDLAPKTGTRVRVCDRLPGRLRLLDAPGARVRGQQICWRRPMPAGVKVRRVAYTARAIPSAAGRTASTARASAPGRDPASARAGVNIRPILAPPPIVTG